MLLLTAKMLSEHRGGTARRWIMERMQKTVDVEGVPGTLTHFLIEPFMPHKQEEEHYVCIQCHRYFDEIYFCRELGLALYWKLKKDPNSRVDEIIDERFPGTDPTKWDFSSFMRSAPAPKTRKTPSASRKRKAREPLGEEDESEGEGGWDSDEHVPDNE